MLNQLINKYEKYDITYDPKYKTLNIHKPISVKDFVNIRNIIKTLKLDVKNIIVSGW